MLFFGIHFVPMKPRLFFLLPLFSAILFALALPSEIAPMGIWPLGFVALAPLYLGLLRAGGFGEAALLGALFGALQHGLTSYWLFFYKDFALWTIGGSTLAYAVVYAVAAIYGRFLLAGAGASRPAVFAIGWAALEYLKSVGFLGYPWGLIPYSMTQVPIMLQTADLFGVYGVSALLSYVSAILGEWSLRGDGRRLPSLRRQAAIGLACLALFAGYGAWKMRAPLTEKSSLRSLLVQQNTDPWIEGELSALRSNVNLASDALDANRAAGGADPELIIFSETSLRRPYAEFRAWFESNPQGRPLASLLRDSGAHLLTGAPIIHDWKTFEASNATLLISPQGDLLDSYAKIHPVPFAEAVPLMEFEWFRTFMRDVVGMDGGWKMGDRVTVFELPATRTRPSLRFGTPICFEDAFSELCRSYVLGGADLLINLTNDSWSRRESAQLQHWAIARIRAIELRRTLVRSTNAGVSSVIDPRGVELYGMPQFEAKAAVVAVPVLYGGNSLFLLWGEWFAMLCVVFTAARFVILVAGQVFSLKGAPVASLRRRE